MNAGPRILLVGAAADTLAALARNCPREDIAVFADAQSVLAFLSDAGAGVPPRPRLIVIDNAGDATAAVAALKKTDAVSALLPLVVIAGAAEHDACYRAGANACLSKPPALGALAEAVAAIVAFWLSVNELPNGTD